jgi:hypothetical protein
MCTGASVVVVVGGTVVVVVEVVMVVVVVVVVAGGGGGGGAAVVVVVGGIVVVVVVVVVGGGHGGGHPHHQFHHQQGEIGGGLPWSWDTTRPGVEETKETARLERTEAFDESAGIATTIRALAIKAHNAVRAHLTPLRMGPADVGRSSLIRPCICSISDGHTVRTRTLRPSGVR